INLLLFDINIKVCEAFEQYFSDLPNAIVRHRPLQQLEGYDCIVSPANSFGMMDGGIDKYIVEKFGSQLMIDVQNVIIKEYVGEQPVGTS
ncbi:phage tail protein, partial [Escherichia coli]